jgi:hypothetical protein
MLRHLNRPELENRRFARAQRYFYTDTLIGAHQFQIHYCAWPF